MRIKDIASKHAIRRHQIQAFGNLLERTRRTCRTLAPAFATAFAAYRRENPRGTLIEYVRTLNPRVPRHAAEYRFHPTYTAARFLLRESELQGYRIGLTGKITVSPHFTAPDDV